MPLFRKQTAVDNQNRDSPATLKLHANYPNPFNPDTVIPFTLPESSTIELTIYDVNGRCVYRKQGNTPLPAGYHEITWQAAAYSGGVYVCLLTARNLNGKRWQQLQKMCLIK